MVNRNIAENIAASQYGKEGEYWIKKLPGEMGGSRFPYDSKTTGLTINEPCLNSLKFKLPRDLFSRLTAVSNGSDLRLYMLLLAGVVILIEKYTGDNDIIVGTTIYKQNIKGDFLNRLLALRCYLPGNITYKELLSQLKGIVIEAIENQNYPIETLLYRLRGSKSGNNFSIFDTAVLLENIHEREFIKHTNPGTAFYFSAAGNYIECQLEYNASLYKKSTVERIVNHYINLMRDVVFNVDRRLQDMEILSGKEKNQLLSDFNDTAKEYPNKTIHRLFEEQVEKTRDHIAVFGPVLSLQEKHLPSFEKVDAPSSFTHISYMDLDERSDRLAHDLQTKGVLPDTIVGIMVERSVEMVVGILGILKSGGAYLPIDPGYPKERIDYMMNDSGVKLTVTANDISECPDFTAGQSPNLPLLPAIGNPQPAASLAYIIYTSGTTAKPKGVLVEHRNAANTVNWFVDIHEVGSGIRILQVSDYTFDASVNQIFAPLISGAGLYIAAAEIRADMEKLRNYIVYHRINIINFVPGILKELLGNVDKLERLHTVLSGAEILDETTKEAIIGKGYRLFNQYGPTETAIDALVLECSPGEPVSLGKPISNVKVYILDKYEKLLPIGVVGELYITGAGVARGYLNRPGLTAEKFLSFPNRSHRTYKSYIIYRTGDQARWLPEGNIEFIGRIDRQVKIRGYRIELGEIENCLSNMSGVKEAVVSVRYPAEEGSAGGSGSDAFLCAYFVSDKDLAVPELKENLSKYLPGYMIPSYFERLEKIPLTTNGKVDRKSLPEPEKYDPGLQATYVAPRSDIERTIAGAWQDVLKLEKIGIHDNFFDAGGNSLTIIKLAGRLKEILGKEIPVILILKYPTIKSLVQYLNRETTDRIATDEAIDESIEQMQESLRFLEGDSDG